MKCLLAVLPFDIEPDSIPLPVPLLSAQLEKAGYAAFGIDFNAELYNEFLTEDFIKDSLKRIENKQKSAVLKNEAQIGALIERLPEIKDEFKHKKPGAAMSIDMLKILKIVYSSYDKYLPPWKYFSYNYQWENIKKFASDKENNIFYNFLLKYGKRYNFKQYDFTGISLPLENSIYYAFTLAGYIKKTAPHTKIIMGGADITRLWDDFIKYPEIFEKYCDNLLAGDGDNSIVKYAEFVSGKLPPSEIAGLVYKNEKSALVCNPPEAVNINDVEPPSYKNINLSKYSLQPLAYIQFSRGCTWGRCSFCTFSYPYTEKYSILDAVKAADMIENIVKTYNIKDFSIADENLPRKFLIEFADEIIKRNLNVSFQCMLRFASYYTKEIFDLIYKAGFRYIFWGYESDCDRILKLMDKGITGINRNQILKTAKETGIVNRLGFIAGFPSETEEELQMTIDFIIENYKKTFDWYIIAPFSLEKNSRIIRNPDKFGITNLKRKSTFGLDYNFEGGKISTDKIYERIAFCRQKTDEIDKKLK